MFNWRFVLDFWFGHLDDDGLPDALCRKRWFRASKTFDWEIRRRFLSMVLVASEDGLDGWRSEPGGALAEILLLDQFTRNIHRGTALAFSNDRLARRLCLEGLDQGRDVSLPPIMRAFFYMPLQHSERLQDQERVIGLYDQLVAQSEGELRALLQGFLESARNHAEIVQNFGRFPHRNRLLGRTSTSDERQYLEEGGARFGQ